MGSGGVDISAARTKPKGGGDLLLPPLQAPSEAENPTISKFLGKQRAEVIASEQAHRDSSAELFGLKKWLDKGDWNRLVEAIADRSAAGHSPLPADKVFDVEKLLKCMEVPKSVIHDMKVRFGDLVSSTGLPFRSNAQGVVEFRFDSAAVPGIWFLPDRMTA